MGGGAGPGRVGTVDEERQEIAGERDEVEDDGQRQRLADRYFHPGHDRAAEDRTDTPRQRRYHSCIRSHHIIPGPNLRGGANWAVAQGLRN